MRKITKSIISVSVLGFMGMMVVYSVAWATGSATVSATVTVQQISLSVSSGTVAYGAIAANSSQDTCTTSPGLNDAQTVTNNGNVPETFNIKGVNTTNWTLGSTTASDQYVHKFLNGACSTFTGGTALTTTDQALASNIAAAATVTLNLQITTPNPSTVFTQQDPNVTLTAIAY